MAIELDAAPGDLVLDAHSARALDPGLSNSFLIPV
jgi:hypothetical protein